LRPSIYLGVPVRAENVALTFQRIRLRMMITTIVVVVARLGTNSMHAAV
jgi:hypothetical protein